MKLTFIDFAIILAYLLSTVVIGFVLKKQAQKSKKSYLLGGNRLPWYLLGLSNASGMFDISGTMWLVTIGVVYGLKSVWLPWLWPVFNQIFLMVYLSIWLRRSGVTTGGEWIGTRFGTGTGAKLSHNIVVVFALLSCLGFLAYGFIGLGKFIEIFIPWEFVTQVFGIDPNIVSPEYVPHVYGIVFTFFATLYAILGGMVSIVWADLLQYIIMTISSLIIGIIAMNALAGHPMVVPEGWYSPWFGWKLEMDWTGIITEINQKIESDGYSLFSLFFWVMVVKGVLVSAAGPAPNYDMQKILATKSPREGALMSGFVSVVLNPVRYIMITGFVVLGIVYYDQLDLLVGGQIDFEQILPSSINEFVPVGLMGLLLAGLLAAFMSTFAGTLNAAQAYITNDLYIKYMNPKASTRQIMFSNYASGILTVVVSVVLGLFAKNVNQLLQIIVSALWGSYMASNILKWYWWRFNAHGYFYGMLLGIIVGLAPYILIGLTGYDLLGAIYPSLAPDIRILYFFPIILAISTIGCILGTYLKEPTDEETLKNFYKTVRPWGFWKPIHDKVVADDPNFKSDANFKKDVFNIVIGTITQTAIVILPIYFILMKWGAFFLVVGVIVAGGLILKRTWYDKLKD
jgi:Na+/proline symporter